MTSSTGLTGTYSSTELDSVTLVFAAVNITATLAACPVGLVKVIVLYMLNNAFYKLIKMCRLF